MKRAAGACLVLLSMALAGLASTLSGGDTQSETAIVALADVETSRTLPGILWPRVRANVLPRTNGVVTRINVERGQRVSRGDVLFIVDRRQLENDLARRQFAKQRAEQSTATSASIEIAQADLELRLAEIALADTRVRAPIDGVVMHIGVREGDYVSSVPGAGGPPIVIADGKTFVVEVEGDEIDTAGVVLGASASVFVNAKKRHFRGTVLNPPMLKRFAPGPLAPPVFGMTVQIDEEWPDLQLGLGARVDVVTDRVKAAAVVPIRALFRRDDADWVVLYSDGSRSARKVKIGLRNDAVAQVLDLAVGTRVHVADSESGLSKLITDAPKLP